MCLVQAATSCWTSQTKLSQEAKCQQNINVKNLYENTCFSWGGDLKNTVSLYLWLQLTETCYSTLLYKHKYTQTQCTIEQAIMIVCDFDKPLNIQRVVKFTFAATTSEACLELTVCFQRGASTDAVFWDAEESLTEYLVENVGVRQSKKSVSFISPTFSLWISHIHLWLSCIITNEKRDGSRTPPLASLIPPHKYLWIMWFCHNRMWFGERDSAEQEGEDSQQAEEEDVAVGSSEADEGHMVWTMCLWGCGVDWCEMTDWFNDDFSFHGNTAKV